MHSTNLKTVRQRITIVNENGVVADDARPGSDAWIAAVLSGSAGSALPDIDHAATTPLFLATQVAM